MKHLALTTGILLVAISLIAATEAQGTLYTQVVTQDCSVDLTAPATRGGGLTNIKVLNHSLWLIGTFCDGHVDTLSWENMHVYWPGTVTAAESYELWGLPWKSIIP